MKQSLLSIIIFGLVFILCFSVTSPMAADGRMKVAEMAITTKIVKRDPVDSIHSISATSVKLLYCFTKLVSLENVDTVVHHVWYMNDKKVAKCTLPVRGKSWRTYSSKIIRSDFIGEWRVEALDDDGNLLKSIKFRVN